MQWSLCKILITPKQIFGLGGLGGVKTASRVAVTVLWPPRTVFCVVAASAAMRQPHGSFFASQQPPQRYISLTDRFLCRSSLHSDKAASGIVFCIVAASTAIRQPQVSFFVSQQTCFERFCFLFCENTSLLNLPCNSLDSKVCAQFAVLASLQSPKWVGSY